jgi:hypothetical protein
VSKLGKLPGEVGEASAEAGEAAEILVFGSVEAGEAGRETSREAAWKRLNFEGSSSFLSRRRPGGRCRRGAPRAFSSPGRLGPKLGPGPILAFPARSARRTGRLSKAVIASPIGRGVSSLYCAYRANLIIGDMENFHHCRVKHGGAFYQGLAKPHPLSHRFVMMGVAQVEVQSPCSPTHKRLLFRKPVPNSPRLEFPRQGLLGIRKGQHPCFCRAVSQPRP